MNTQMPRIPIGSVIARRVMQTVNGSQITISVGAPVFVGDGWDWACPFRIDGLLTTTEEAVFGVDALQSLQLVSPAIRHVLEESNEQFVELEVNGHPVGWGSAFPLLLQSFGDRALEDTIRRGMEDAISRWAHQMKESKGI